MTRRAAAALALLLATACSPAKSGGPSAPSPTPTAPPATIDRSLLWQDPALLDDPAVAGLARVLPLFATDGKGGALLDRWFHAFATASPDSQRYGPGLLVDSFASAHGANPDGWNLDALPFRATGIQNRIDRRSASESHCGELRISFASTDPVYQPFFLIFLFRQPVRPGDVASDGTVTCEATGRRFAELATVDEATFRTRATEILAEVWTPANALLAESVEQTVSPWEWRQWHLDGATPTNPPLYEAIDVTRVNASGADRDAFLSWVGSGQSGLDDRTAPIAEAFRSTTIRRTEGQPAPVLDLGATDVTNHPDLRKHLEIVGCPSCHTADADFVHTHADRTRSPFFEKELEARRAFLDSLNRGDRPVAPYGPLQPNPVLPP